MSKIKSHVGFKPEKKEKDEILRGRSVMWSRPIGGGQEFENNVVNITLGKDGHISFSSDDVEHWIYFYPEQVKHLKAALRLLSQYQNKKKR